MVTSQQLLAKFGDPSNRRNESKYMILWDVPAELEVGVIPKRLYCHQLMIPILTQFFRNLIDRGLVKELKTFDGCFNVRKKRGLSSWSLHAWGLAIDVNASWNQLGAKPTLTKAFVKAGKDAGLEWGGDWTSRVDGMHFQIASV